VRGEIFMLKRDFEKLNLQRQSNGLPAFANPRNLAAGTIRQLDPKLTASRPRQFHAYDVLRRDSGKIPTHIYAYEAARALGVPTNLQATVYTKQAELQQFIHTWETKRHELSFNTDGLVIKVNDRKVYTELGIVGKNPRAAVAYKFPAEEATTVVRDIVVSIGIQAIILGNDHVRLRQTTRHARSLASTRAVR